MTSARTTARPTSTSSGSTPIQRSRGDGLKRFAASGGGFDAQELQLKPARDGAAGKDDKPEQAGAAQKSDPAAAKSGGPAGQEAAAPKKVDVPKPNIAELDDKLDAASKKNDDAIAHKSEERTLEVSAPNDPVEKEAEAVADAVIAPDAGAKEAAAETKSEEHGASTEKAAPSAGSCAGCGSPMVSKGGGEPECASCGTKASEQAGGGGDGEEGSDSPLGKVMKKAAHGVMRKVSRAGAPVQRRVGPVEAQSAGEPLSGDVREAIEPHLGADLGAVRVHSDAAAVQKSESLGAKAFTSGSDIFLGRGASANDVQLMAHEATHVVQQSAAPTPRRVQRLGVDDFIPDAILDAVRSLAGQGSTYAEGLGSRADSAKSSAKSQADAVPAQAKGQSETAAAAAKSEGDAAKSSVDAGAAEAKSTASATAATAGAQAKQVQNAGPLAQYATDPVRTKVEPPPAGLGGGAAAQTPAGAQAPDAGATMDAAGGGGQQVGAWDCDGASIVAKVTDLGRDVVAGLTDAGRALGLGPVMDLASEGIAMAQNAAARVRQGVDQVKTQVTQWLDEQTAPVRAKIAEITEAARATYESAKAKVMAGVDEAKQWASEQWTSVKQTVSQGIEDAIGWAKSGAQGLMQRARALVGRLWDMLPEGLKSALSSAVTTVEGWISTARAGIAEVQGYVGEKATEFQNWAVEKANEATGWLGEQYVEVKAMATAAGEEIGAVWNEAKSGASELATEAYQAADEASGGRISRWSAAAADTAAQLKGEACRMAGDYVGPCIEQALPDPTQNGQTSFASLALTGDLTVPIYGVPVKVAAGASIGIEKEGDKYTATLTGEGTVGVSLAVGGGGEGGGSPVSFSVGGTLPEKVLGMQAIGAGPIPGYSGEAGGGGAPAHGGGGAPAHGAGGGGAPAQSGGGGGAPAQGGGGGGGHDAAGAGGGGVEAEVEGGYKVEVEVVYEFDASPAKANTCAGLGGLAALLVSQGAGAMLPQPFGAMAQNAGNFIAAENMKSAKMSVSQVVAGKVEGEAEGVGGGELSGSAEMGVSGGMERDEESGAMVMTASVFQKGSVEGELKLEPQGFALGSIGGGVESEAELQISYDTGKDEVDAEFTNKAGAKVALGGIRNLLGAIPGPVRGIVEPKLNEYGISGSTHDGEIGVELEAKITNLRGLASAIDGELSKGSGATATGLWTAVKAWYAQARQTTYKVELTATEKVLEAEVGGAAGEGPERVSGTVGVAATRGLKTTLASGTI